MPGDGPAGMQMPSAPAHDLAGFRLVTLCGSAGGMHDAMRDSQDLLEPVFVSRGIDVRPVDLGDWSAAGVPKLVAEIKRQQPDGILMQYPTGAFGRSLGPILLSLVHHVAPTMVMLHEFAAAQLPRKAAVGALLLRADRIGYTAERERKHVTAAFPWLRNRMREVPIASNIPSRVWAPTDPVTITYFGQLRPNKGIEEFVEVRRRIAAELPEARFEIIGAVVPQHADYAEALQRTSLEADISIAANLGVNEVADGLARSTVALMPFPDGASFRRGSLFAAASCGAPIATTIGVDTPPELLPFLEPAQTIDELTAVTLKLLRDPAAREAAHQNSMIFSAKFGWEQTADSYCKVFRELKQLGRGNPRSTDATRALSK